MRVGAAGVAQKLKGCAARNAKRAPNARCGLCRLPVTPVILYTATVMPYNIFFEIEESPAWVAVDLVATVLFLVRVPQD